MYFCALSGEPPQDPVVSAKSGQLYERRLITKYISENGTEPTTGEKLDETDLIALTANPKAPAPRPPTATSIPALLHSLQNEYDAILLETFAIKQQYQATRQELSHALYQQDAATRVVARLIRERDAAREALASVSASMGVAPPVNDVEMVEDAATQPQNALPAEVSTIIEETHASLSAIRKKRKAPTDYVKPADVKTYKSVHTIPSLHSSTPSGINAIVLSTSTPSHFLTAGNDKHVQLYDRAQGKVLATLKGHTKKIHHVAFREREGENTLIISGAADKTVRVWGHEEASGQYAPKTTIKTHKGDISGIDVHPSGKYLVVASADGSWSLQDLTTFQTIYHAPAATDGYSSLSLHPDGCLLALGTASSSIQIYDVRVQTFVASLAPEETETPPFTINTLSFSENGYHLAAPGSTSTVSIWDLRKQKSAASISLASSSDDVAKPYKINRIRYDPSALWFGVAGNHDARLISHKTWDELVRFEEGGEVKDLAFGPMGKEVWGVSGREVRIWGAESAST
ncbi:hypothetical protein FRB96_001943 [Tulasnella sp. 330]|nr:hypothetical protein FRB96_001943 [Tulasnella sp. 330]KAG8877709.1 hypothetical protein FRB97_003162 [Tulasnella sp. 331]KAG8883123.1 hypothetical protein FRB98_003297 [Tulasnella sp. 332]